MVARLTRGVALYLLAASSLSLLSISLDRFFKTETGLMATLGGVPRLVPQVTLDELHVDAADLEAITAGPRPGESLTIRWSGTWHVSRGGAFDFYVAASPADDVRLVLDGRQVAGSGVGTIGRAAVQSGFHDLQITYMVGNSGPNLYVQRARAGGIPGRFDHEALFPHEPTTEAFATNQRLSVLRGLAALAWLVPLCFFGARSVVRYAARRGGGHAPRDRRQWALGAALFAVSFVLYFAAARSLEPTGFARDDLVLSADSASTMQAIVWGPTVPRGSRHPLFLVVRPLAKMMQGGTLYQLFRVNAALAALALIAAVNCLLMFVLLSRVLGSIVLAGWFAGLYGVSFSNIVLFSFPEAYSLATLTVLLYLYVAARVGERTSVGHAVLFGMLAGIAGLANPPLASLALIYVCGLAVTTTTLSRTARLAGISIATTAVCFLTLFFLASGIISRTGAGYRSLSLSTVMTNEAIESFAEGFVHVDSYASFAHFANLDAVATTVLSFLLYSVVAPLPSLTDNLTMADMGGYFSSVAGIVLVTITSGFVLIALVNLGRAHEPVLRAIMLWFVAMLGFYLYFNPFTPILYVVQLVPVLVLAGARYFSELRARPAIKYAALAGWMGLLVYRNVGVFLAALPPA